MTPKLLTSAAVVCAALGVTATAIAQSSIPPAVEARQGQFQIMALNVGVLGNMARGNTEYDAEAAQAAADNLVAISSLNQVVHWPAGTDNFELDGTRALPAIWEDFDDFASKWGDFGTAATAMAAVAGDGLDAVRGSIGAVGGTCGACHDVYRADD
jgi:cytochrome c556